MKDVQKTVNKKRPDLMENKLKNGHALSIDQCVCFHTN